VALPLGLRASAAVYLAHYIAAEVPAEVSGGGAPLDIVGLLIQSGPFAFFLLLIIMDKVAPTGERNRLRDENAAYKTSTQELNNRLLELMPPLLAFTDKLEKLVNIVDRIDERSSNRRGGRE
jgi:hypothetical protein